MRDVMTFGAAVRSVMRSRRGEAEGVVLHGTYLFTCRDRFGNILWRETIENTVMTVGKNLALDTILAGSAYTVTGPFMGLISSTSFSAISAADTMASHAGWLEAGGANAPTYSGSRPTMAFNAASGGIKATSTPAVFNITGSGTIKGAFVAYGSGASATIGNTGGTLLSAGLFTGGDQPVVNTNVVDVSWQLSA